MTEPMKTASIDWITHKSYFDYWYPEFHIDGILIIWCKEKQPDETYSQRFYYHLN